MIIILFRHGHKSFSIDNDPSLSPKGFHQAENLELLITNHTLPVPTHCWFSEKIRTKQTLEKCFHRDSILKNKTSELNYREHNEDSKSMLNRVKKFLNQFTLNEKENHIHFICTHYDWIEEAMKTIPCDTDLLSYEFQSWAPGQYIMFNLELGLFKYIKKGLL